MSQVTIKTQLNDDIRRFAFSESQAEPFKDLSTTISRQYGVGEGDVIIRFKDDEGDLCLISCNEELEEAIRLSGPSKKLKLILNVPIEKGWSHEDPEEEAELIPNEAEQDPEKKLEEAQKEKAQEVVEEPAQQPEEPAQQPEEPAQQPEEPAQQPEEPAKQPEEPAKQPEELAKQPEEPLTKEVAKPGILASIFGLVKKRCSFSVTDENFPDGSTCGPNMALGKTWVIINSGPIKFPQGCQLVWSEAKSSMKPTSSLSIPLPALDVGESFKISCNVILPSDYGRHTCYFSVEHEDFTVSELWIDVLVEPEAQSLLSQLAYYLDENQRDSEVREAIVNMVQNAERELCVHKGFTCDGCNMFPIVGARYHCTVCSDFDLCEACEAAEVHPDHNMLKVKLQKRKPKPVEVQPEPVVEVQPEPVVEVQSQPVVAKSKPRAKSKSQFVDDVTLPDGSKVMAGEQVVKTWRFRNVGDACWPKGTYIKCVGGLLKEHVPKEVPLCHPGHAVDVSVILDIPDVNKRATGYYRLCTEDGVFGQRVWVDLNVLAKEKEEILEFLEPKVEEPEPKAQEPEPKAQEPEPKPQEPKEPEAQEPKASLYTSISSVAKNIFPYVVTEPSKKPAQSAKPEPYVKACLLEKEEKGVFSVPAGKPYLTVQEQPKSKPVHCKFPKGLEQLVLMGFEPEVAAALLDTHNGNVEHVVNEMLM